MKIENGYSQAVASYFIAGRPLAMLDAAATSMLDEISSVKDWDLQALAAKSGEWYRPNVTMRGSVAVLNVVGPIFRYANLMTRYFGLQTLENLSRDFAAVQDEKRAERLVMVFDSPGGQATGISEMAEMIKKSKKPVIAYVDGMAASAAYWMASAAGRIIVSKTAELGSIGAILGVRTDREDGVVKLISSQSPLKQADPGTESGRNELQRRVDALAQVFIEDVAENRKVSVETVLNEFGRGGIRMGDKAVKLGMADEVSTFEEVVRG
ncbi:MAG: S49 family peptidase [Desulfobulbaceae bacterium]|nr:S49 family peptidase [Desulfobulbaceae bacterium]